MRESGLRDGLSGCHQNIVEFQRLAKRNWPEMIVESGAWIVSRRPNQRQTRVVIFCCVDFRSTVAFDGAAALTQAVDKL
jgi:hypothetical protein